MKQKIITWCLLIAIALQAHGTIRGEENKKNVCKTRIAIVVGGAITAGMLFFAVGKLPKYLFLNRVKNKDTRKQPEVPNLPEKKELSSEEKKTPQIGFDKSVKKAYFYRDCYSGTYDSVTSGNVVPMLNELKEQQDKLVINSALYLFDEVNKDYTKNPAASLTLLINELADMYKISFNDQKQCYELS